MKQNGASVAKYYNELTEIFQELDQFSPSNMEHPKDIETRCKEIDRLRIYIFLVASVTSDATALAAARSKQSRPNNHSADPIGNRPPMKCTKCGLDNHTIKGYYEIIGYPEGWFHKERKKDLTRASFASDESSQETASKPPLGTSGFKA
ncbi:unnamed protein product, partial [Prunus brigantina]